MYHIPLKKYEILSNSFYIYIYIYIYKFNIPNTCNYVYMFSQKKISLVNSCISTITYIIL